MHRFATGLGPAAVQSLKTVFEHAINSLSKHHFPLTPFKNTFQANNSVQNLIQEQEANTASSSPLVRNPNLEYTPGQKRKQGCLESKKKKNRRWAKKLATHHTIENLDFDSVSYERQESDAISAKEDR